MFFFCFVFVNMKKKKKSTASSQYSASLQVVHFVTHFVVVK